ncbi:hypothetical protein HanRHA438_Chr02g0090671 [Helianthus annuus]|nr:hypothetical protein HanHA300_Chr02g0066271 [Helianthus annuus]KAJ0619745.1 hypothetical protein HanHA89_Chr02g0074741 [Helianthus annuus]KAJ0941090.1 hypothetical protein HanRHA438_Chr02g0090671 [Helianthus annuus]
MQFSTDPHGRKLVSKSEKERMKKLEEILTPNRLIGSITVIVLRIPSLLQDSIFG